MAAQSSLYPVYTGHELSSRERWRMGRKFGKYDFDRFRPLQTSRHFLGKEKIGEMEVACKFLFQKSRWGVLTPVRNPGGILYMDLVFTEPPDCYLRGATIVLTLDENDKDLQRHFSMKNKTQNRVPVHVTEHGPQNLGGQLKTMERFRTRQFIPTLNAGGFVELGGMGQKSETRHVKESQWRFSSQAMPDRSGRPTILRWDLSENDLDRQPKHTNTFHTAFAFEHDGQPFFIRLAVSGVLENTASNFLYRTKRKLKKFKFPGEPQTATTLVNFGGRDNGYTQPLDEYARMIVPEMVRANMASVEQVQTTQTPQASDPPDDSTIVQDEETASTDGPISQATTNVPEEEEMAEMKENALALISLPRAKSTETTPYDTYIHAEKLPKTPHIPSRSFGEDESFDESSPTALGSENGSEQSRTSQKSPSLSGFQKTRDLLRDMGVLPILMQLVVCLIMLRVGEKYSSRAHHGFSPTETR
ncbi:hypothetical protein F4861DRAFT_185351 [Xylaria intraflava]|nr:hypothetical protein F4861DRAFT_185351 [Xylaria intraflava]